MTKLEERVAKLEKLTEPLLPRPQPDIKPEIKTCSKKGCTLPITEKSFTITTDLDPVYGYTPSAESDWKSNVYRFCNEDHTLEFRRFQSEMKARKELMMCR